jgi:hypothetical protein
MPVLYLIVASICGFLIRQPMTIAVKALSGRRPRSDLPAALFWTAVYGLIAMLHALGLAFRGMGYLLYLAIPGVLVFAWYLALVRVREERRQIPLEIIAAGVFALTAPAGLWAAVGHPDPAGWWLWLLAWAQSAASILHVYLRLQQRGQDRPLSRKEKWVMGLPSLTVTTLNLLGVAALGMARIVSPQLFIAYLPQWIEALRGSSKPARGWKPSAIGFRQLGITGLYTLLFIWTW